MPLERLTPDFDRIVSADQDVEELGTGFIAAEGPVWWQESDYLLFSDHRGNRRYKWTAETGVTLVKDETQGGNGQTRDRKGRLIVCERIARRLARFEADGELTVMANEYRGLPLNSPNDVVVKSDGAIYFTDPGAPAPDRMLDFAGVYRLSPDRASLTLLVRDCVFPNGLAFSPDERVLYLIDTQRQHIRVFDVQPDGMLGRGTDRVFFQFAPSDRPGLNDGMKVDSAGNVYCTGPGGVWVIDPAGRALGIISAGPKFHTNCAWGGGDWKTLFITTRETLCRIRLNIAGVPVTR
jgi:gluconolactonase